MLLSLTQLIYMISLREIFEAQDDRRLHKWNHYIEIYDSHFSSYRDKEITFLEIGVADGGSLQMWRKYFGEKALLIGVDVNPECKKFEEGNTKIIIGSQENEDFLKNLKSSIPIIDILIDDGGHTMKQQNLTFKHLFNHVTENGLYVCEDLHTSYWYEYGGGLKKQNTFIEFTKGLIDNIHGWHIKKKGKKKILNWLTESIYGLHFYDSIIVIEKRKMQPPQVLYKGKNQNENHVTDFGQRKKMSTIIKSWIK
jgi:hypothetical protein